MNEDDKKTISDNISSLKIVLSYEQLTECCLNVDTFYYDGMRAKIERMHDSTDDRLNALLIKLTKRGPTAFITLLNICDRHFPKAANILRYQHVNPNKYTEIYLTPYYDVLLPPTVFDKVIPSEIIQNSDMQCYKMRSKNRGVAFIVNIIHFDKNENTRNGAHIDQNNLVTLFRQMGFVVYYYKDITKRQFFSLLEQLRVDDILRTAECLVFALMTHGRVYNNCSSVEFSDSEMADADLIYEKFRNINCPNMIHKPKVFFMPYCRGNIVEKDQLKDLTARNTAQCDGLPMQGADDADPTRILQPIGDISDMKICYATSLGYTAQRDSTNGSWYIASLCKIFAKYAHEKHLDDLLKLVGTDLLNTISEYGSMQTPCNEDRGFFKRLYFNPGKYE